ncbi:MAG TPA: tocopherol cyclase family protein [bacterium]|nr:tocopherol cyclase family protein [bacterium]
MEQKERDNIVRWDGARRGWYEVYYLKWNDAASRTAYWVRYTLTSPLPGVAAPYCELWGIFFDAADPAKNFAVKERFPIDKLAWDRDRFRVGIAEAELLQNSCHARIADAEKGNALEWDIRFDSATPSFHHFPHQKMYELAFPKTKVLSPHQHAKFSGRVAANGREIAFSNAPGQQTHIWGTKHALRWAWGHCNSFREDPEAVWEGLDSQIKLGPVKSPHLNLFYLKHRGRDYLFNSVARLFTNRSRWELGRWSFAAKNRELRIAGEVSCNYKDMVAVTYTDPDGEKLWCNNSKVAAIRLTLFGPDGSRRGELTSDRGSAAEFVDRRTYPEVPVRI